MIRKAIVYILISLFIVLPVLNSAPSSASAVNAVTPTPPQGCYTAGSASTSVSYCLAFKATGGDAAGHLTLYLQTDTSTGMGFNHTDTIKTSKTYTNINLSLPNKVIQATSTDPLLVYEAENSWEWVDIDLNALSLTAYAKDKVLVAVQNSKILGVLVSLKNNSGNVVGPFLFDGWKPSGKAGAAPVATALKDVASKANTPNGSVAGLAAADPANDMLGALSAQTDTQDMWEIANPVFEKMFNGIEAWKFIVKNNGNSPPTITIPADGTKRPETTWVLTYFSNARGSQNLENNYFYFKLKTVPTDNAEVKNILTGFQKYVFLRIIENRDLVVMTLFAYFVVSIDHCFGDDKPLYDSILGPTDGPIGVLSNLPAAKCPADIGKYPLYCSYEDAIFKQVYNLPDGTLNNTVSSQRDKLSLNARDGTFTPLTRFLNLDPMKTGADANSNAPGYIKTWVKEEGVCRNQDNLIGADSTTIGGGLDNKCNCGRVDGNWIAKIVQQGMCGIICWLYDLAVSLQQNATCWFNMAIGTLRNSTTGNLATNCDNTN